MARDDTLPFPRGKTYFEATSVVSADNQASVAGLLGREFIVHDPDYGGMPVTLMVVQYDASVAGTAITGARKCIDYLTAYFERKMLDLAPSAEGKVSHPLDHQYYGLSIQDGDLVYAIKKGPCIIDATGDPAEGVNVVAQTDGTVAAAAAGEDHVLGYVLSIDATNDLATVMVGGQNGIE